MKTVACIAAVTGVIARVTVTEKILRFDLCQSSSFLREKISRVSSSSSIEGLDYL